jgi:hypothetical protein
VIRTAKALLVLLALAQQPSAVFEGKNTLIRPEGYREWIFVGSSLGLSYAQDPSQTRAPLYHNVYMIPWAYREFSKTGKLPEGTMMVLELATAENKSEPGLQGSYEKDYAALEVSVKNSARFDGGWGYFNFTERPGVLKAKADPNPKNTCWACHDQRAATDHVFTQFYPVLRAAQPSR